MVWPNSRPDGYEDLVDMIYDETNDEWTDAPDILQVGGGRNREALVAIGNLKVYFGEFPVPLIVLKDYYNTIAGSSDWVDFGKTRWLAQTFTASSAYTISSVKLWLFRSADYDPKTITVTINSTEGTPATPTSTILCSGTTNGSTLPTSEPEWREITFDTSYALTQGITYAIVVSAPQSESNTHGGSWVYDTGGEYAGGALFWTGVGGYNGWEIDVNSDYQFETYGE